MDRIQSITFDRSLWTQKRAEAWLRKHGYKTTFYGKTVDITPNFYRYRQMAPSRFKNYYTKVLDDKGIHLIIGI